MFRRVMDEIDGAAEAWDAYQRFVMGLVGIAMLVGGAVLFIKPDQIPEFPYRQPVAIGVSVMGLLWCLAIYAGKSGAGKRAKCLLVAMALGLLSTPLFIGIIPDAIASWQLSSEGQPTTATVTGRRFASFREQSWPVSRISYDGHHKEIRLAANVGDRIPVLYLSHKPEIVSRGDTEDSFLQLVEKRTDWGIIKLGFMTLIMLMFAGGAVLYLKAAVVGPSDDMVD